MSFNSDELLRRLIAECDDLSAEATRSIVINARELLARHPDLRSQITEQVLSWVKRAIRADPGSYGGKTVYQWDAAKGVAEIKLLVGGKMVDAAEAANQDPIVFDHVMRIAADAIEDGGSPPPILNRLVAQVLRGEVKRPIRPGRPGNRLIHRNSICCIGLAALRCAGYYPAELTGDMESGPALIANAIFKDESTIAEIWGDRVTTLEQVPAWHCLVRRIVLNER